MSKKTTLFCAYLVFFIDNFGYALVFPLFAPLLLNPSYGILPASMSINAKNLLLGILTAAYPFAQFFGAPFFGDLADKFGRRKGFFWTIGGITIGYLITGGFLLIKSYFLLLCGRVLTGFFAGNWSIAFATVADLSPQEKLRAKRFAWIASISGVSWVLSMIVGGEFSNPRLLTAFNPSLPFWIAAFISFIAFIAVLFYFQETAPLKKRATIDLFKGLKDLKKAFFSGGNRGLYLVNTLMSLGWTMILGWVSATVLERFNESQSIITFILILLGIVWSLSSSLLNPFLIKKYSLKSIVFFFLLIATLCAILAAFFTSFSLFSLFFLLLTTCIAIVWSNLLNLISISVSSDLQGVAMGLGQSTFSAALVIGPPLGGLIALINLPAIFFGSGVLLALATLLLVFNKQVKGNA